MSVGRILPFGIGIMILAGALPSHASLVTYGDFPTWSSAVGGFTTVTIPDPGSTGFIYFGANPASVTYGPLTFSTDGTLGDGNFFNVGPAFTSLPPVLSDQNSTFGVQNILITFPTAVTAFAFNYGTFNGNDVTFLLSNGDTFTQASTNTVGTYAVGDFAGATDTPFTSVLVTSADHVLNVGDVSFVAAAAAAPTATPEPGTISLLAMAGLGLVAYSRRRRA